MCTTAIENIVPLSKKLSFTFPEAVATVVTSQSGNHGTFPGMRDFF